MARSRQHASQQIARTRFGRPLHLLVVTGVLLALLVGGRSALLAAPTDPSPAEGSASVIAQGVAPMPAENLAWRVLVQTALPLADAKAGTRSLGFIVPDVPLLIEDEATSAQTRIAPGEAALVQNGSRQKLATLTPEAGNFRALELVDAETAQETRSGEVTYVSEAFAVEGDARDLDLVQDGMRLRDARTVPASEAGAPVLIMAVRGAITVSNESTDPVELFAGQAVAIPGPITIQATQADGLDALATFVAAVIGPEAKAVEPSPTAEPTEEPTAEPTAVPTEAEEAEAEPTPPSRGSITVTVRNCPAEERPESFDPENCELANGGWRMQLYTPGHNFFTEEEAAGFGRSSITWSPVRFGEYLVIETRLPRRYELFLVPGAERDPELGGFQVVISPEEPHAEVDLYNFTPDPNEQASADDGESEAVAVVDSDEDGIPDDDEVAIGGDPNSTDGDGDGLADADEYFVYGTAIGAADTDEDGVNDSNEITAGTDPTDPESS